MNYLSELKIPQRLNLYRMALGFLKNKIFWDLKSEAWKSRKSLTKLKDSQKGKKVVILCNGPSLNSVDFEQLQRSGVYTIGLNKINLLFERSDFRPDLIVSVNKHVIQQNADFYNETQIPLILDSKGTEWVNKRDNVSFIHSLPFQLKFAGDITGSVCQGYTVTYVALQAAFHMGFEKVALVGCDHNFATQGSPNMTVKAGDKDPNHFSDKYFSDGVQWQLPDLLGSEMHYKIAKEYFEMHNREIFNCTLGGKLEIYNRLSLKDFLDNE